MEKKRKEKKRKEKRLTQLESPLLPRKVLITGFKGAAACTHSLACYLCHVLKSWLIKLGSKAKGKP